MSTVEVFYFGLCFLIWIIFALYVLHPLSKKQDKCICEKDRAYYSNGDCSICGKIRRK